MKAPWIVIVIGGAMTMAIQLYFQLKGLALDPPALVVVAGVCLGFVALVRWLATLRRKDTTQ